MKKRVIMLLIILLAAMIPVQSLSQEPPINVFVEGEQVVFKEPPFIEKGTTLVPFRPIFEKLGLAVRWDAKTQKVTGVLRDFVIELQIGKTEASVRGEKKQLLSAPRVIKGTTYVPIRFVGEAADLIVNWDSPSGTITLLSKQIWETEKAGVLKLFEEQLNYELQENLEGVLSTLHKQSPLLSMAPLLREQYEKYDVKSSYEKVQLLSIHANTAAVRTVSTSEKINGPFYLDSRVETMNTLKKSESGQWKLYDVQLVKTEYMIPEGFFDQEADISGEEKEAILSPIKRHSEYMEKENTEGVMSTMDKQSSAYAQMQQVIELVFKNYDLFYKIDKITIVQINGNEAYVYAVQHTNKVRGPEYGIHTAEVVHTMKKSEDGIWKFYSTQIISVQ